MVSKRRGGFDGGFVGGDALALVVVGFILLSLDFCCCVVAKSSSSIQNIRDRRVLPRYSTHTR